MSFRQSAEAAPLPAALVATLGLALLFQLLAPVEARLPDVMVGRPQALALRPVALAPVAVPPAIIARSIFAPNGGATAGNQTGEGAIMLLGVARARGVGVAVLRTADGGAQTLRVGGRSGAWRVTGVGASAVRLNDGTRSRTLRIGQSTGETSAPAALSGDE